MLLCFQVFLLLTDLDAAKLIHVMQLFIIPAEKYHYDWHSPQKKTVASANTSTTTGDDDSWLLGGGSDFVAVCRGRMTGCWHRNLPPFPVSHSRSNCFLTTNFLNCDQVITYYYYFKTTSVHQLGLYKGLADPGPVTSVYLGYVVSLPVECFLNFSTHVNV